MKTSGSIQKALWITVTGHIECSKCISAISIGYIEIVLVSSLITKTCLACLARMSESFANLTYQRRKSDLYSGKCEGRQCNNAAKNAARFMFLDSLKTNSKDINVYMKA